MDSLILISRWDPDKNLRQGFFLAQMVTDVQAAGAAAKASSSCVSARTRSSGAVKVEGQDRSSRTEMPACSAAPAEVRPPLSPRPRLPAGGPSRGGRPGPVDGVPPLIFIARR